MNCIDMKSITPNNYKVVEKELEILNFSNIISNTIFYFKQCKLIIDDDLNNHKSYISQYIFEECDITFKNINIYQTDSNFLNIFYKNNIKAKNVYIWVENPDIISREFLSAITYIKTDNITVIVGNKNSNHLIKISNTSSYFNILQKEANSLLAYNVNIDKNEILYPQQLLFNCCTGKCSNISGLVNVLGESTPKLEVQPNTTIYAENIEELYIDCKESFNFYLDDLKKQKFIKYTGVIKNTNCPALKKFHKSIYKFRLFINTDFSNNCEVQQFFNCKFYNCYFNENQLILNSKLVNCKFENKNQFVKENTLDCIFE